MTEPAWLSAMRKYIGTSEIKGPQHNPTIIARIDWGDGRQDGRQLQGIANDEVPWCASFLSGVLEELGILSARSAWARSYAIWGQKLGGPAVGAIVVFERGPSSGHVAIVAGKDARGNLVCIGANQSDTVKASPFAIGRVIAYRWPPGYALPSRIGIDKLPVVGSDGRLSSGEA